MLLRLMALVAAASVLVAVVPAAAWLVAALAFGLVGLAVAEGLALRRVNFAVEGRAGHALYLGEEETVSLAVRTDAPRPLRVVLRQLWPSLLAESSSSRAGLIRPGEALRFEFRLRGTRRGRARVPAPVLAATFHGLAERIVETGISSEVAVIPDLRAVGRLHAKLNRFALRGYGTRMSARLGKGREFDRLREYVRGDEFRDIAWKASARHDKLIVREHRLDRSQDVLLCLDAGHRMAARVAGLSRLDHAVNGAVLLSYGCNRLEDRVGLLSFAAAVTRGPRSGRGSAHLRRVTDFAAGVAAGYVHSDYLALASELRRGLRHRTLVVIFTALSEMDPEPLLRAVRAVSPPHLVLLAV
ncbi:MAG TPA: DUF58 domain-containing protein, partial [Vicinamibacteria bacterium]|nr:DUF58 domain-containing protein [Vicinamibacteria bacterium]